MNISSINFKGNFSYDDEISSSRRDAIREHLFKDIFQSSDTFRENNRLEEYGLKKLISKLTKRGSVQKNESSGIDASIMEKLPLCGVRPITGTTSYRGATVDFNDEICEKLKQAGVQEVVSFLTTSISRQACERTGLKYYSFPIGLCIWNEAAFKSKEDIISEAHFAFYKNGSGCEKDKSKYLSNYIKTWEYDKRDFIKRFISFINEMKKTVPSRVDPSVSLLNILKYRRFGTSLLGVFSCRSSNYTFQQICLHCTNSK